MQIHEFAASIPVVFGAGAVSVLGEKLAALGCRKAMLVSDPGVIAAGITDKARHSVEAAGVACCVFDGVEADPGAEVVDRAGEMALREGVDCLVGVGGGSSMDTAKAASILLENPGPAATYILGKPIFVDTRTPVFLVPTTTGTGSEVTKVAVISRHELNVKWSVFVNTTMAIVDPELTVTLPLEETANTGLDALAHATEGLTSIAWNPHADLYAEGAIVRLARSLVRCYHDPENLELRTELSLAANFGGFAFRDPLTHVGHAVGDALGCHFHTPHGQSCSLGLAEVMRLIAPAVPERMARIARCLDLPLTGGETGAQLGDLVAAEIHRWMREMHVRSLEQLGYTRQQVIDLAPDVVANHLSGYCPVPITEETARTLLANIYDSYR